MLPHNDLTPPDEIFKKWVDTLPASEKRKYYQLKIKPGTDLASSVSISDLRPVSGWKTDEEFFASNPFVKYVTTYAREHGISAWAALDACLIRVASIIPFNIRALIPGSGWSVLNLFLALVGKSGTGKGRAWMLARQIIPGVKCEIPELTSGEGLAATFGVRVPNLDANGKPDKTHTHFELDTSSQTIYMSEVVGLQATMGRAGSTIEEAVNRGWSGEQLGTQNRDRLKRVNIPAMGYRLTMYLGVQPAEAKVLASSQGSGFTQRFLFANAEDPGVQLCPVFGCETPEPLEIHLPSAPDEELTQAIDNGESHFDGTHIDIRIPIPAAIAIGQVNTAPVLKISIDPLDAHRMQMTARIAVILSIIEAHGLPVHMTVTPWAWRAALHIMEHSARVRADMLGMYQESQIEEATAAETTHKLAQQRASQRTRKQILISCAQTMINRLRIVRIAKGKELRHALQSSARSNANDVLKILLKVHAITNVGEIDSQNPLLETNWTLDATAGLEEEGSEKKLLSIDTLPDE